jgi:hypothetical protein
MGNNDMSAQIPGFTWLPANTTHFQRGRTEKIRGGAQHYTAGVDSRAWLTWQSRPPVSSTFLVRKNATMQNRGWQLVRIEDTAWTTAFANPYTVSIEYEHIEGQPIPPGDMDVLAQTWIDIARYVADNSLGEIPLTRDGIRGHKEWVNNPRLICPNGIRMDDLVARIKRILGEQNPPEPKVRYFPQTGHFIAHGFKSYWEKHDNPAQHGYPISEEFDMEIGDKTVTVQYFERARYEYHAENKPPYDILLGRLGAESITEVRERYPDAFEKRPAPGSNDVPHVSLDSWIPVRDPNDVGADAIVRRVYSGSGTPAYSRKDVEKIAASIVARSSEFGFRVSILTGQIMHETGMLRFGGQVRPGQWNFAGLGAVTGGGEGASFPDIDTGVLAVCCHLALYVWGEPPDWPKDLRKHADHAIRRNDVRWAHENTRKDNGELLGFLGVVSRIRDLTNGRWAYTPSVPRGTLDNGYAAGLVRHANAVIDLEND